MTQDQLLDECKKGLNISKDTKELDDVLKPKLLAVKSFMINSGVKEENITSDLGIAILVTGVSDLWNLEGGEVKFSPIFYTLLSQLVYKSQ